MKKKLILLSILLISVFALPVNAKSIPGFYAKEKLVLEGDVEATTFAAGESVEVTANIDGASFIAGQSVKLHNSQDVLFTAGESVELDEVYTKDAFILGKEVKIKNTSLRDLFVAGETLELNSPVKRNLYFAGDKVIIDSEIGGDVYIAAATIEITDNAIITGTLKYPEDADADISSKATIGKKKTYVSKTVVTEEAKREMFLAQAYNKAMSIIAYTVLALISMLLFKNFYTKVAAIEFNGNNIAKNGGIGFGTLVLAPIAMLMLLLIRLTLPVSIIALVAYILFIYLANLPSAYFLGNKLLKDKINNEYIVLALSVLCLQVVKLIPFVGGIVSFVALCFGLGTYVVFIFENANQTKTAKKKK